MSEIEDAKKDDKAQALSEVDETGNARRRAKGWVVALVTASSVGAIIYRVLMMHIPLGQEGLFIAGFPVALGHTGLMFIGLPAILAIILAMAGPAKTVTGGIVMGITLVLLIIAPLMGEGYLCILFVSPLFYAVGVVIGLVVDAQRKKRGTARGTTLSCVAVILLPMCLEGVVPQMTFDRAQTVGVTQVVDAPADAVEMALAESPRVDTVLPRFLRIGFPRPLEASGDGLALGDVRRIHFSGAEGDPAGDLVMRVVQRGAGYARFATVSDASKLTQWVRWDGSEVEWRAIDAGHTRVTWTIHFERQLDPAWYFAPWERAAVREAATYLIEANATPARGER